MDDQSTEGEYTGPEEVELLRKLLERADEEVRLLTEIRNDLKTFLTDWVAANTAPSDPAVKVTLTWGKPQDIPKGT